MSGARVGLSAVLGAIGFIAADFLVTVLHPLSLWYEPLERRFFVDRFGGGAAMGFYGLLLWCLLAGALSFGAGLWLYRSSDEAALRRWATRSTLWLGLVLACSIALHLALLVGRHPVPLDPPAPGGRSGSVRRFATFQPG